MITFFQGLLYTVLMLLCLFMILIILLQRGKGGGLVGAFGGLGGSSAFGAKTGDVFMKITIYATFLWFLLCLGGRYILTSRNGQDSLVDGSHGNVEAPANPAGDAAPAPDAGAAAEAAADAAAGAVDAAAEAAADAAAPAADAAADVPAAAADAAPAADAPVPDAAPAQ
ncbi:MAG: preprotein translocase subunit SecG [Thermoguttaceae bacterium]|nr:preprotein translocase subunit SecG [Thermoguttaceae bacterium]